MTENMTKKQTLIYERTLLRRDLTIFQAKIRETIAKMSKAGQVFRPTSDQEQQILTMQYNLGLYDAEIHVQNQVEAWAIIDSIKNPPAPMPTQPGGREMVSSTSVVTPIFDEAVTE